MIAPAIALGVILALFAFVLYRQCRAYNRVLKDPMRLKSSSRKGKW